MTGREVVGKRGVVGPFTALKVVGTVAGALVVVGEDDEARGPELELLLGAAPNARSRPCLISRL